MMNHERMNNIIDELINKDKWTDILRRFSDVLKINIFIVDGYGRVFVPPYQNRERGRYGSKFLASSFGFDFSKQEAGILDDFEANGKYFEAKDPFDFHIFAIPIKTFGKSEAEEIFAYIIVGPVILTKGWSREDYLNMANVLNMKADELIDIIHEIRVVSFIAIKAILDLLAEVVKDVVQLNAEKKNLSEDPSAGACFAKEVAEVAQDIYATIHLDEMLISILDVCLNLAQAECGSIMLMDKDKKTLSIKVSKGIDENIARSTRLKIGEGIAGVAAKENETFLMLGSKGDHRIKNLMCRSDIRQSAVIPLSNKDEVLGVLNLHTKKDRGSLSSNLENIKHLSNIISTAISSI